MLNEQDTTAIRLHKGFFVHYGLLAAGGITALSFMAYHLFSIGKMMDGMWGGRGPNLGYFYLLPLLTPALIGTASLAHLLVAYFKSVVIFTPDSLRFNTGLIFRTEGHLAWRDLESVFVHQGPLGSLLGYGTLVFVGRAGTPFRLDFMPDSHRLRDLALERKSNPIPQRTSTKTRSAPILTTLLPDPPQSAGSCANQTLCHNCRKFVPLH
jgi:hypothetical protein